MSRDRMLDIAVALKQVDPINWIARLREFNKETEPPRVTTDELNKIIVRLGGLSHAKTQKKTTSANY